MNSQPSSWRSGGGLQHPPGLGPHHGRGFSHQHRPGAFRAGAGVPAAGAAGGGVCGGRPSVDAGAGGGAGLGSQHQGSQPRPGDSSSRQGAPQQGVPSQGGSQPGSSQSRGPQQDASHQGGQQPHRGEQAAGGRSSSAAAADPCWQRPPYATLFAIVHAGADEPLPVGPPPLPHRDVQLMVELQGVPVDQRRAIYDQVIDPTHPLGRVARSVSARHIDGDNAALLIRCKPTAVLQGMGIDMATEAANWRAGAGLEVEIAAPGGGRPARVRLPVRAVPSERPPGFATVKILGLTPAYAISGVTAVLLESAGYVVTPDTMPRVGCEFMAPTKPGSMIGRADVVIAYVACPPEDPGLRVLPRRFSMGSQSVKIEVLESMEPITSVGPAWAFAPSQGGFPVDEETGMGMGSAPQGLRGGGQGVTPPPPRTAPRPEPSVARERAATAGVPRDPMHVDQPEEPGPSAGLGTQGGIAEPLEVEMAEGQAGAGVYSTTPVGVAYVTPQYNMWRATAAFASWEAAITHITSGGERGADEIPGEGVDATRVVFDVFERFAWDPVVNLWERLRVNSAGQSSVPSVVRQWLIEMQYIATYGDDSSSEADLPGPQAGSEQRGRAGAGQPQHQPQQQQQQQQPQQQQHRSVDGVGAGCPHNQATEGQGQGSGREAAAPQRDPQPEEAPLRRSTRERRQAPLASELPGSLAASARAAASASNTQQVPTRPPHPDAGGARRST